MDEMKVNTFCPACKSGTPKHTDQDLLKFAVTYEQEKSGMYKQWWHRSCLIGQQRDDLVSGANSLCHEVEYFLDCAVEMYRNRGKNTLPQWEVFRSKIEDLKEAKNEVLDEVIKWL